MTHLVHTLNHNYLAPVGAAIVDGARSLFSSMVKTFEEAGIRRAMFELRKYRSYRETYGELSRLSDAELRDIGLHRGMIHSVSLGNLHGRFDV